MILKWDNKSSSNLAELKSLKQWSRPLWTIDIFCLLKEFDVQCKFLTTCIGTGPHHKELVWYSADMEEDAVRVASMFERAATNRWDVQKVHSSDHGEYH